MAKGRFANPTDKFRKAERRKEIKKNKLKRKQIRDAMKRFDPYRLQGEIEEIEDQLKIGVLTEAQETSLKERINKNRDSLIKTLDGLKKENESLHSEFMKWKSTHEPRKYVVAEDSLIPVYHKSLSSEANEQEGSDLDKDEEDKIESKDYESDDDSIPLDEIPMPDECRTTINSSQSFDFNESFLKNCPMPTPRPIIPFSGFHPDYLYQNLLHPPYPMNTQDPWIPTPFPQQNGFANNPFSYPSHPIYNTQLNPIETQLLQHQRLPDFEPNPHILTEINETITISAAPQLRNMEKELKQFIPASLRKKNVCTTFVPKKTNWTEFQKKITLPKVNSAPMFSSKKDTKTKLNDLSTDDAYAQFTQEMSDYL